MDQGKIFSPVPVFARDSFLDLIRKEAGFSQFFAEKERWEDNRANSDEFQIDGNWFGKASGQHETH